MSKAIKKSKGRPGLQTNTFMKIAWLVAIVVVAGVSYWYTIGNSTHAGTIPIYVSEAGSDSNSGETKEQSVRSISRAIYLLGERGVVDGQVLVVGPDFSFVQERDWKTPASSKTLQITASGFDPVSNPYGQVNIVGQAGPDLEVVAGPGRALSIQGFKFSNVRLATTSEGGRLTLQNNTFNYGTINGGLIQGYAVKSGNLTIASNEFRATSAVPGAGLSLGATVAAAANSSVSVYNNSFIFPSYYRQSASRPSDLREYYGVAVGEGSGGSVIIGSPTSAFGVGGGNTFQTINWSGNRADVRNPHNKGVYMHSTAAQNVTVSGNNFKGFDGIDISSSALRAGTAGNQDYRILNNKD